MLFQMLAGVLPFRGDSMAELMFKIANEAQPDIHTLNPQVPDRLVAVIDRALRKDVSERYQSGDEMARDLRACLSPKAHPAPDIDIVL